MNNRGSISIFLIIISSLLITSFLILFQHYSIALAETDIDRSLNLVNRNILANYEDEIYNNYGILAYEESSKKTIEKELKNTFNNFSSPLNLYRLEQVKVDYETIGMYDYNILLDQIIFFSKNKISLSVAKDIFTKIGKSNLYLDKTKEIKAKLSGNKGYEKLKKIHRNLKSTKDSLESLEENAYSYIEVIEIYENNIEKIRSIEIDEEIKDLQNGIDGLEKEYQKSYDKINLEYKKLEEIIGLKREIDKKKKKLNRIRLDESVEGEEKLNQVKKIRNQLSSLKKKYNQLTHELEALVNVHEKGVPIKKRLEQLKNSINQAKNAVGYGNIKDYGMDTKKKDFETTFDQSILLNEYILGTFKSVVTSNYRDFDFYSKRDRVSQSNGEVEYIIKGYKDSVKNVAAVGKDIFLIREGMNLAHLFIDYKKREFIFNTAKTPAIGVFAAAGLTALWTTAESSIDLFKIYNGNGTPLLKISEKDFVLDLGIILDGASIDYSIINKEQMMYYQDYLRLFLYTKDDHLKISRILDVMYTEYPIDTLVLKHDITAECTFINKFTGNKKKIITTITGEYIYE